MSNMSLNAFKTFFLTVCQILLFAFSLSQQLQEYKYYKSLDLDGNYILGWRYNASHIEFQITVNTTGYVGFGISKNGEMYDADIVMGWISDSKLYLGDYYTTSTSRSPFMDIHQDWFVQNGREQDGYTVLEFARELETCDLNDIPITKDRLRIIWSYAMTDPQVDTGLVPYHGELTRGSTEIFLLESDRVPPYFPPANSSLISLKNYNFTIPANGSSLQCIGFDLSNIQGNIIKFNPDITPGNEAFVYRMIIYRCNIDDVNLAGMRFHCEHDAPLPIKSCKNIVATWSMGAESFHFPDNVGIPMGGPTDPKFYVLEIHYSKFDEVPYPIPDYSGLNLTYTTTPVVNKAGMLELGKVVSPGWKQFIPAGEPDFTTSSLCSPRCMNWGFASTPKQNDTIKIIGVMLKGNDIVREIKLRHFRGDEELPLITVDKKFSNFYQGHRVLDEPVEILPNDSLSVECTFNTTDRQAVTRGGWSRVDEVCRATVVYYPAKQFDLCLSWSSFDELKTKQGNKIPETQIMDYLTNITKWDAKDKELFKTASKISSERSICSSVLRQPAFAIDRYKQKIKKPYIEPQICAN